ncbi:MAG: hypothetical protein JNL39_14360 [Opitutaceae bacterium]|nr:hypothetical protein [Opitutaceae bacterium]
MDTLLAAGDARHHGIGITSVLGILQQIDHGLLGERSLGASAPFRLADEFSLEHRGQP